MQPVAALLSEQALVGDLRKNRLRKGEVVAPMAKIGVGWGFRGRTEFARGNWLLPKAKVGRKTTNSTTEWRNRF